MARWLLLLCFVACSPETRGTTDDDSDSSDSPDGGGNGFVDAAIGNPPDGGGGECTDVVDVVLVLDVSSSMGFVLDKLGTEMASVVSAANALAPDAHFGLVVYADNHRLDTSGPLEGGKVHTQAATLQAAFENVQRTYTDWNINPGDGPGGLHDQNPICEENSLDALHAAVAEFPWRANATRVVIVATDDTFLEPPDNYGDRDHDGDTSSTDYPREGHYPAKTTLAGVIAELRTAKTRVFAFTRLAPPLIPGLQCSTSRRFAWADISDGWSTPYAGADPIPMATQGKNFDLQKVRDGSLSLSATINEVVLDSFCNPPIE